MAIVGRGLLALIILGAFTAGMPARAVEPDPTALEASEPADTDPMEDLNRFTSGLNRFFRKTIIDPVVDGYQAITPEAVQKALSNAASNLAEPVTATSSLLQGDIENTKNATGRFLVNSTFGLGGARDPAREDLGMEQRREDLGTALGHYGVPAGPHVVLPILGPSNLRDAFGDAAVMLTNPLPAVAAGATGLVTYSDHHDDIQGATASALNPYVVERDAYEQRRVYQIQGESADAPRMTNDVQSTER